MGREVHQMEGAGSAAEQWRIAPGDKSAECVWPTAAMAGRVADKVRHGDLTQAERFALARVCDAYVHLLTHPAGVEAAVQRLRGLRRAEREECE